MSGKPCIHCGAHVNYFSGSKCDVGHLHRACWKAFHSTPIPETESPKHQQRWDEETVRTETHDDRKSNDFANDVSPVAFALGRSLRFVGPILIIFSIVLYLIEIPFGLVILIGAVGLGMQVFGKKLTPGEAGARASKSGAGVGIGLIVVALIVVGGVILYFLKAIVDYF